MLYALIIECFVNFITTNIISQWLLDQVQVQHKNVSQIKTVRKLWGKAMSLSITKARHFNLNLIILIDVEVIAM